MAARREKLEQRLLKAPKDFSYAEAKRILESRGFEESVAGKTGGSRVRFVRDDGASFEFHKPHRSGDPLKAYQVRMLVEFLRRVQR